MLELSDRIEHLPRNPAFITPKDHTENLNSKLLFGLINLSKSELGKVRGNRGIQTHNQLVRKLTLENLAKLAFQKLFT